MKSFFNEHRWFLVPFAIFYFCCAVLLIQTSVGDIFTKVNETASPTGVLVFKFITQLGEEIPYLLMGLISLLYISPRKTISLALTGLLTTIISFGLKSYFAHPRPYLYYKNQQLLDFFFLPENIDLHSGFTSFPSGHTMSAFALYGAISFLFLSKNKLASFALFIAIAVGFSRIYLFQHFLKDVFFGAILGVLIAIFTSFLDSNNYFTKVKKWNHSLLSKKESSKNA